LVAEAKQKHSTAMATEDAARQEKQREQERLAMRAQEDERQRQSIDSQLSAYRANISLGERVMAKGPRGLLLYGLVVEVKPPLAYVQWENKSPALEWVRLDWLLPPDGGPSAQLKR
jgi:hypothetical protein